jgi:hypothetical protein
MSAMRSAASLLRLYPRAWRERYGDEFIAMLGEGPLRVQQVIDIVSGAIDAWVSSDVRGVARAATRSSGGTAMDRVVSICDASQVRYTKRDGLIGAGVMLAASLGMSILGITLKRSGWIDSGDTLVSLAFPVSLTLSMPFWMMKNQPRSAQVVIVGATLLFLVIADRLANLL